MSVQFVALKSGSAVAATSPDGVTWTDRTLPSSASWADVCWNGSVYVAVATGSNIAATSSDGVTWAAQTLPSVSAWESIAWNGTVFCVMSSSEAKAVTSPDGATWTAQTTPSKAYDVAWNGATFCAVGVNNSITSADGATWTSHSAPILGVGVAWNGSVFCSIAGSGTGAATSPDGATWTSRTLATSQYWASIAWNGTVFCAGAYNTNTVNTSPDGVTWTAHTMPSGDAAWYQGIAWNGDTFCAVSGTANTATSTDGTTWAAQTMASAGAWYSIAGAALPLPPPPATITCAVTAPTVILLSGSTDVAMTIPAATLVSQDVFGAFVTDNILPAVSVFSGTNDVVIAVPAATVNTYGYAVGATGAFSEAAPVITLVAGANDVVIASAVPEMVSELELTMNVMALFPHVPELVSNILTGEVIAFTNSAPLPVLELGTKDFAETLPAVQMSASVLSGVILTVTAAATAPILTADLTNPAIITAANSAAAPQLAAAMATGTVSAAALAARVPILSAQVLTGNVASLLAEAATPIMAAAGYPSYTLTFSGTAPAPYTNATLSATLTETYRTWVLNTRRAPLTEYDNFPFNSYAVFNGKVIAAGSSGLVELGAQDTDAGVAIPASWTLGEESFASSMHKRVPRIYLGYEATGEMRFSTITVEGGTRTYSLPWNGLHGTQQRRVPVGKGPKSRFWSFGAANVDGADFEVNDLLVYPTILRRRVM